jgi:hypothetical protein
MIVLYAFFGASARVPDGGFISQWLDWDTIDLIRELFNILL